MQRLVSATITRVEPVAGHPGEKVFDLETVSESGQKIEYAYLLTRANVRVGQQISVDLITWVVQDASGEPITEPRFVPMIKAPAPVPAAAANRVPQEAVA